jgi:tetratricopeptide (TPR) repeat protein
MKTGCWMAALIAICMGVAVAAAPAAQTAADLSGPMRDFERNATLGAALTMRVGLPEEFEEVQQLAERGLAAARQAVARQPGSAEAQYLLGSWLLYGYQVVEVRRITSDPVGGEHTEIEPRVVLGLSDTPDEGLAALLRAAELAPKNGQYLLDYATALMDCDRVSQALPVLKKAWAGEPELRPEEKMLAGLLLSDAYAYEGQLDQAREWVYAALSLDPAAAKAIERLRHLDAAQAAAVEAALDDAAEAARAEAYAEVYGAEEEVAPEGEQQEEGWAEGESGQQEEGWVEGEQDQPQPYTGAGEQDQAQPYTGEGEQDQPQPYTGEY